MYCPACGTAVKEGLNFCNNCGGRLYEPEVDPAAKMLDDILETLFWTAIVSLGILIGLVAVMLNRDLRQDVVGAIVVAYLACVFGICFTMARQIPKLIDAKLKAASAEPADQRHPAQLRPLTTAQLEEHREPIGSVTDSTTRTLSEQPIGGRRAD